MTDVDKQMNKETLMDTKANEVCTNKCPNRKTQHTNTE